MPENFSDVYVTQSLTKNGRSLLVRGNSTGAIKSQSPFKSY